MKHYKLTAIGNPVDAWWNTIRREIATSIDLLGQFPPAPDATSASEILPSVYRAHDYVKNTDYPHQAGKTREFLLTCLYELVQSLKEQSVHGLIAPDNSHNMAYYNFMRVSQLLRQRGIYEPDPCSNNRSKVG